ncbi:MAG TPA: hypothetical protein VHQ47_08760 [Phycisphaerae bacterium]|jgi:hypothetical protein|nr:hypothetical protein [Phycisphaerae bacterium]
MLQIGLNSQVIASKSTLSAAIGQKAANLLRAIREMNELKLMVDEFADADLKTLGFGDGTGGTDNEIGFGVRTPLLAGADLFAILNGQAPTAAQPTNYLSQLRYVAGGQS